jgi:hypothetical protein
LNQLENANAMQRHSPDDFRVIEAPRGKAARNLPMQGIVFYYSSLANPAQAGIAVAVHFQIVPP